MANIIIKGAKQNNLKGINVEIPKHQLTVFTGRSGSGKSSLVFSTIAAESERLLNETYSTYIQNQLTQYEKPDVDAIHNLPVSMVISQKRLGGNSRSTVGTISDIYSAVRLLWSRIGEPFVAYSNEFSFNNPAGMCETCHGLGYVEDIDVDELLDYDKSLNEHAINFPTFGPDHWRGKRYTNSGLFDNDKKLKDYTADEMKTLLYTEPKKLKDAPEKWPKTAKFEGVINRFRRNFLINDGFEKNRWLSEVNRVVTEKTCPTCHGKRLNSKILSCKINKLDIADFTSMTIRENIQFLDELDDPTANYIIKPLRAQLQSLVDIGLGYLTLSRETPTLSGGESQRIKLIRHLNSPLTDLVYIIDEPSVGLHPEDIENINRIIQSIRDKGNTVLVVEHDPDIIKIADHVIDIGPGAGKNGGNIIFQGSYADLLRSDTATGHALKEKHQLTTPREPQDFISLKNISKNNLHDVSVDIPKDMITTVTGVAGSGKSTLIKTGFKKVSNTITIDQKPVHASNRSNLLTYTDIFDDVRAFFSSVTGLKKSLFSYNSDGACPNCNGKGILKTELAYMPDFSQVCEVCHGTRYKPEVLDATVDGYSIADVLKLTVDEGIAYFNHHDKITETLKSLQATGLGYMTLGQSLDTLSGGEVQRVKLSKYLIEQVTDHIFIFDEPTTGLHEEDIHVLVTLFNDLVDQGNTVILIEHNLTMMTAADWIVDMGPEAGQNGGRLLYSGPPAGLLDVKESYTARHLKRYTK
ncbi:ATP-binding cassette domain-containing protein [Macrococcus brunensis]|uniref:ATP-binding cassette domain-containing protein n=1 Tax=Macrococcus brunensis TaxID=198483 RepID=UPI001EF10300|nr:excinuclease ABC subunit UvrA [Macrococcus brunensis]ULG71264.1 excinuclease ABC subunit UvrA [Macrococcus brunensis]